MSEKLERLWATKTKQDEWWSSFVTSPLAIAANYLVVDLPWLTPNRITALSFVVAVISAVFIVKGGTGYFILAAILIHLSHILDCMDGQMARYRQTSSASGSYFDKLTDQVQVTLWFGTVGYAAYAQSADVIPVFLAFIGVAFYGLRGYTKYVAIQTEMSRDSAYLMLQAKAKVLPETAGIAFDWQANIRWFVFEQRKILGFNEGVFVFMLSLALVLNELTPMLWVFALSQGFWAVYRAIQHGIQIESKAQSPMQK